MDFVELTEKEFGKLRFSSGSFLQSVEMYWRYRKLGRETYLVGVKKDGKVVAAGLMLARAWHFGKKIMRVPGGWLMDYDAGGAAEVLGFLTEEAREFVREKRGIALEISPDIVSQPRDLYNKVVQGPDHLGVKRELEKLGYKYLGEWGQAKWIFVLDLKGKSKEEVFMNFRTTPRQRIRKAEKQGVRVRELKDDELGILKEIAAEAGERHGFKDPEADYYRSMKEAFGNKVKFVVAEIARERLEENGGRGGSDRVISGDSDYVPLAAAMFVNDGREMVYLYSGSVRELQKYNGAYAIQWQMIQEAIEAGCERYNFYGVKPVEGNGVYQFKQGFHGVVEELLGTFCLPVGWLGKLYVFRIKPREYGEIH